MLAKRHTKSPDRLLLYEYFRGPSRVHLSTLGWGSGFKAFRCSDLVAASHFTPRHRTEQHKEHRWGKTQVVARSCTLMHDL